MGLTAAFAKRMVPQGMGIILSALRQFWKANRSGIGIDWKSIGSARTGNRVLCFPPVLVGESLRLRACLENSALLRQWDSSSPPTAILEGAV